MSRWPLAVWLLIPCVFAWISKAPAEVVGYTARTVQADTVLSCVILEQAAGQVAR